MCCKVKKEGKKEGRKEYKWRTSKETTEFVLMIREIEVEQEHILVSLSLSLIRRCREKRHICMLK
jgi:hypothetical protein